MAKIVVFHTECQDGYVIFEGGNIGTLEKDGSCWSHPRRSNQINLDLQGVYVITVIEGELNVAQYVVDVFNETITNSEGVIKSFQVKYSFSLYEAIKLMALF